MMVPKRMIVVTLSLGLLFAIWAVLGARPVLGQETANAACLACHGQPGMQTTLPSGETLYLTVDPEVYNNSVHGARGQACIDCHPDVEVANHPKGEAAWEELGVSTRRDLSLKLYRVACIHCHPDPYDLSLDGVHQKALAAGDVNAAICTDCHGTHNIGVPDQPRSRTSRMCERCHSEIFELYKASVHGEALIGEGNPEVPSCTDCHHVHCMESPATCAFRLFSPQICAECHADQELMAKYGISTEVFETYVADFHGTTVVLFEKLAPDQETNKPVCIDCHGVHDMRHVNDPESTVIKENLLTTCRKCHPDATANFPTSWIGHYPPSPEVSPLVYFVRLFYTIFIPAVLAVMVVFVATGAVRRIVNLRKEHHHA